VGDDQRKGVGVWRSLVDEVNIQPVDFSHELVEAIERRLSGAPVVTIGPVAGQLAGVGQRDALTPVVDALTLRPSSAVQAVT
jgi:hypothetical protein